MEVDEIMHIMFLRPRKLIQMRKILHYALSGAIKLLRVNIDILDMWSGPKML